MKFDNSIFLLLILFTWLACKTEKNLTPDEGMEGPTGLTSLSKPISEIKIYSNNIDVKKLQAFDIDGEGNIYYARLGLLHGKVKGKNKAHEIYIYKANPNQQPKEYMTLQYFGHPYNISVEVEGEETYIWIGSNGSKRTTGKYWDERSVSRIKYVPGKVYKNGYGGESYFLNDGKLKTQVTVNRKTDLICIAAEEDKDWSFYTYKLSEVEALPDTSFTFSVTMGGEDIDSEEQRLKKTVRGHDLSRLTPIGSFTIPGKRDNKPDSLNSFWLQGFGIDANRHIYFYEGEGNRQGRSAQAYVTALDLKGHIVKERTKVEAIANHEDLDEAGIIHNSGNLEPEGMAIKGSAIYLGVLSHEIGKNNKGKRANILRYDSHFE